MAFFCPLRVDSNICLAAGDSDSTNWSWSSPNMYISHICTQIFHPTTYILSTYAIAVLSQVFVDITNSEQNRFNTYLIDVDFEECYPRTKSSLRIFKIILFVKSELPSSADTPLISSDAQEFFWFSFEKTREVGSKMARMKNQKTCVGIKALPKLVR